LHASAAEKAPLGQNHGPGEHAKRYQHQNNSFGNRTGLEDEIDDFAADKQQGH
jgi:hypothetical protein